MQSCAAVGYDVKYGICKITFSTYQSQGGNYDQNQPHLVN
jgi:hypothetical protein